MTEKCNYLRTTQTVNIMLLNKELLDCFVAPYKIMMSLAITSVAMPVGRPQTIPMSQRHPVPEILLAFFASSEKQYRWCRRNVKSPVKLLLISNFGRSKSCEMKVFSLVESRFAFRGHSSSGGVPKVHLGARPVSGRILRRPGAARVDFLRPTFLHVQTSHQNPGITARHGTSRRNLDVTADVGSFELTPTPDPQVGPVFHPGRRFANTNAFLITATKLGYIPACHKYFHERSAAPD